MALGGGFGILRLHMSEAAHVLWQPGELQCRGKTVWRQMRGNVAHQRFDFANGSTLGAPFAGVSKQVENASTQSARTSQYSVCGKHPRTICVLHKMAVAVTSGQ